MSAGNVRVLLADKNSTPRYSLVSQLRYLSNCVHILRASFRSFRGHIRSQSPKDPRGRCLSRLEISQGFLTALPEPRVISPYLKHLLASYPWCDTVDLRLFLVGFGLGGLHALHSSDKRNDEQPVPSDKV